MTVLFWGTRGPERPDSSAIGVVDDEDRFFPAIVLYFDRTKKKKKRSLGEEKCK